MDSARAFTQFDAVICTVTLKVESVINHEAPVTTNAAITAGIHEMADSTIVATANAATATLTIASLPSQERSRVSVVPPATAPAPIAVSIKP